MIEFLKRYKDYILFAVYFAVVLYLSRSAELIFEWKFIFDDYIKFGGYKYLGKSTAFMPPLYFGYLLLFYSVLPASIWIAAACIVQSLLYYFSLKYFIDTFHRYFNLKLGTFIPFAALLFSPPILISVPKVSSYGFSCVVVMLLLAFATRWYYAQDKKYIVYIALVSVAGLYLRYEFMFLLFLLCLCFVVAKKLKWTSLFYALIFVGLTYLPWCYRNYKEIGVFHYSTSLSYNFSKGNHVAYEVFSSSNLPYDSERKIQIDDFYLRKHFANEKEIDGYLKEVNKKFVENHFSLFIANSFKKIGVVLFNYYPYNYNLTNGYITGFYAGIMTVFNILFGIGIYRSYKFKIHFWPFFWTILFIFVTVFYSVAPLPRYYLIYFPLFFLVAYKWAGEYVFKCWLQ